MTLIGGKNPNVNKRSDTHSPVGISGDQATYLIDKFNMPGLEYISGILFVPNEKIEEVEAEMSPYATFKERVQHYLSTGEFPQ
jgi:hypothetical protein